MRSIGLLFLVLSLLSVRSSPAAQSLKQYLQKPKLVVLIVIDQFRADYLTRFESRFLPADKGGFKLLMDKGAYYPMAEYDVLQSMTCPGHAMISTGAHPAANGIPINEWYDRKARKIRYCVEDDEFNFSPRSLKTTTFGDELKNSGAKSKVVAIALKDRSAIMLGGHRADVALWMDYKNFVWQTSSYYQKQLPVWVQSANEHLHTLPNKEINWSSQVKPTGLSEGGATSFERKYFPFSKNGLSQNFGIQISLEAAEAALKGENLGHGSATDVLAISLSNHDMLGHMTGPNSRDMEELTVFEDQRLAQFFSALKKHLGSLDSVVVVLTADHGVAPTVDYAKAAKLEAGKLDYLLMYKSINERLDKKFGSPKNKTWIVSSPHLHFYLSPETLEEKGLTSQQVESEVKTALESQPGVFAVATKSEIKNGIFPPSPFAEQLRRQYIADKSGDVILIPAAFYMQKDENLVTHMTGYSYDRTVPLIFFGRNFRPGVYAEPAKVIDLAPTLSFILGTLPGATSEGRVLHEIFESKH